LIPVGDRVIDALGRVGVGCGIVEESKLLKGLEQLENESSI
jgi:hypothetical protein